MFEISAHSSPVNRQPAVVDTQVINRKIWKIQLLFLISLIFFWKLPKFYQKKLLNQTQIHSWNHFIFQWNIFFCWENISLWSGDFEQSLKYPDHETFRQTERNILFSSQKIQLRKRIYIYLFTYNLYTRAIFISITINIFLLGIVSIVCSVI